MRRQTIGVLDRGCLSVLRVTPTYKMRVSIIKREFVSEDSAHKMILFSPRLPLTHKESYGESKDNRKTGITNCGNVPSERERQTDRGPISGSRYRQCRPARRNNLPKGTLESGDSLSETEVAINTNRRERERENLIAVSEREASHD